VAATASVVACGQRRGPGARAALAPVGVSPAARAAQAQPFAAGAGSLSLLPLAELPKHVLGYQRLQAGEGGEQATVFLNFSARQIPLALDSHLGKTVHSNIHLDERAARIALHARPPMRGASCSGALDEQAGRSCPTRPF